MTRFRPAFIGLGSVALFVALMFGGVAAYEAHVLRDFRTWSTDGPAPLAHVLYYAHGPHVTEIFVTTVPGTRLADIADMSVFGAATPGLSHAEFRNKHGSAVLQVGSIAVDAFQERDSSPLAGTIERWVLHARPTSGALSVNRVFGPALTDIVTRAKLSGSVHIHNGSSTGFLTCQVPDGSTVSLLRWFGSA